MGSRSALDWAIERNQVKTDTKSGIVNDPNDWATENGNPKYIIDLIKRITTVSVRAVEIVQGLPQLPGGEGAVSYARAEAQAEFRERRKGEPKTVRPFASFREQHYRIGRTAAAMATDRK